VSEVPSETVCIYHEAGRCFLVESFETNCKLCFNFITPYKPEKSKKSKPLYNIFDYLESEGKLEDFFPAGNEVQSTLLV
jgi:hypothetical protein